MKYYKPISVPYDNGYGRFEHLECGKVFSVDPTIEENLHLVNNELQPICPKCFPHEKITPAEALYAFATWLTMREKSITLGASEDMGDMPDLLKQFCLLNNLRDPIDNWTDRYAIPNDTYRGKQEMPEMSEMTKKPRSLKPDWTIEEEADVIAQGISDEEFMQGCTFIEYENGNYEIQSPRQLGGEDELYKCEPSEVDLSEICTYDHVLGYVNVKALESIVLNPDGEIKPSPIPLGEPAKEIDEDDHPW
jgi:hypothetical protein